MQRHQEHCHRCGYWWMTNKHPKSCAHCHSPYYATTRTKGVVEAISKQHKGQAAHIVPVTPIDTNNVIIRQRKAFERQHKQEVAA